MRRICSEKGITLLEVLLAVSIILFIIATLLPSAIAIRKREMMWRHEHQIEQEAIRFFTYLENRNSNVVGWKINGDRVTLEVKKQRDGANVKRYVFKDGERIVEMDTENAGYIVLAQHVQNIRFYDSDNILQIELILSNSGTTRSFHGILSRSIEK